MFQIWFQDGSASLDIHSIWNCGKENWRIRTPGTVLGEQEWDETTWRANAIRVTRMILTDTIADPAFEGIALPLFAMTRLLSFEKNGGNTWTRCGPPEFPEETFSVYALLEGQLVSVQPKLGMHEDVLCLGNSVPENVCIHITYFGNTLSY